MHLGAASCLPEEPGGVALVHEHGGVIPGQQAAGGVLGVVRTGKFNY